MIDWVGSLNGHTYTQVYIQIIESRQTIRVCVCFFHCTAHSNAFSVVAMEECLAGSTNLHLSCHWGGHWGAFRVLLCRLQEEEASKEPGWSRESKGALESIWTSVGDRRLKQEDCTVFVLEYSTLNVFVSTVCASMLSVVLLAVPCSDSVMSAISWIDVLLQADDYCTMYGYALP